MCAWEGSEIAILSAGEETAAAAVDSVGPVLFRWTGSALPWLTHRAQTIRRMVVDDSDGAYRDVRGAADFRRQTDRDITSLPPAHGVEASVLRLFEDGGKYVVSA